MKKYYFKSLILGIMCLTFSMSHSQNILFDGDFSLTTEIIPFNTPTPPMNTWAFWVNYYGNGSDANPMVVDEVCNFQIINPGSNTWDVQLAQWGFPLIQGHSYQLSFDVKAEADRSFGVFLGEDSGNYTNLIGYDRYTYGATSEWQTITIEFEAFSVFPLHKLSFELGTNSTTTYFDNVVLIDLGLNYNYNIVADITALRSHVAANGDGLYYEITGASLVNHTDSFQNRKWLQDSNASGMIIRDDAGTIETIYDVGDYITGLKGQVVYLNDTVLNLIPSTDSGVIVSSDNPVIPQVVSISDFNSDYLSYESEIIELQNVTIDEGNGFTVFNPGSIYHVTDANMNTVLMYIDYWDADHIGTVIPSTPLSSLVSVAGHYNGQAQLYPRSLSDFTLGSSNILYDGDFSLTTEIIPDTPTPPINTWTFWVNNGNGSEANPTVIDGVCNFQIINAGNETWNVQLEQYGFPLIQGHSYKLSFDVRADADRSFGVYLGEFGGNWTTLIGYDRYLYDATTEWQTINIEFEAFSVFPLHKLSFELGTDDTTIYFDNVILTDLGATEHIIGIIGTAVNGWYEDVNMETTDDINYMLSNYPLIEGEVKFRQDDDWSVNWGGDTFPNGIGWQDGPNIPILEGTYDITFNRLSGEYNFMATTCPNPEIICPLDIYVDNFPSMCGAYVNYSEVIPQANCGGEGIVLEQTTGLPSGSFFPVGITTNTFELTNSTGNVATCSFNVTVYDTELPVIADLNENYEPLWPANHKMVPVFIEYITLDNCNISAIDIYISTNEPENGIGDGNQEPDWEIIDEHNVLLRAERSGTGNGREYYITIRVIDDSWNYTERQVTILVPHDNGKTTEEFIQSKQKVNKFILYPNSVDDIINIKGLKTSSNPSYYIVDMYGTIKKSGTLFNNQIVARALSPGIYILKLEIDGEYFFKKFVKN